MRKMVNGSYLRLISNVVKLISTKTVFTELVIKRGSVNNWASFFNYGLNKSEIVSFERSY